MISRYLKYFIILALQLVAAMGFSYPHPGGMHPQKQLEYVKKQIRSGNKSFEVAYQQLLVHADSALLSTHHALADFSIPGFYFKPVEHRRNKAGLQSDSFLAYTCALAWHLNGKKIYAERALYYLNAWSSTNKKYSDADGALVLSYTASALVMAGELMRSYSGWKKKDKDRFTGWIVNVYRKAGNEIRNRPNNWGDWGRFASTLADYYLDDEIDMAENLRLIKSDLHTKIAMNGHMPEEVKREANGIWYTYFSLAPITASCWVIANATRENLFDSQDYGAKIKKALDYLLYFQQRPAEWTWFKDPRTGSALDQYNYWPANLFEAMSGVYNDSQFKAFTEKSRPVMYRKHDLSWIYPTLFPLSF
mgnify:CR=1 FL=1